MIDIAALPPIDYETRAERDDPKDGALDKIVHRTSDLLGMPLRARTFQRSWVSLLACIQSLEASVQAASEEELLERTGVLRAALRREGLREDLVAEGFALVRERAGRTLGLRHFECQMMGGWALLQGSVAEMETGEGKTLTATLAASVAALAGLPVHVITVNDYLTARDAAWMAPVYESLGLTVGIVTHDVPPPMRREQYQSDITYATNKEIVFDYLRDRMALGDRTESTRLYAEHLLGTARTGGLLLRGLYYAIVDEADSILIDEARTPLIISGGQSGEQEAFLAEALRLGQALEQGRHYTLDEDERRVTLSEAGTQWLQQAVVDHDPMWRGHRRREEIVRKALEALHLFHRDEHYLVRDDKVAIVDEFTGRVMADRSWERGLHQLIELKEGCPISAARDTLARISYQRFFRRYLHLSGMTGTAAEVRAELMDVYRLSVTRIPTNRAVQRRLIPDRVFNTLDEKWAAVLQRVRSLHESGHPVLVGTRSVASSEHLSELLTAEALEHRVLNAKFDAEEAQIIASAGERGQITIATNMAGRGTDIKLADEVRAGGGLHVILTERHEAARIDRQLAGRCGRQGDPGSVEALLSIEDPLVSGGRGGVAGHIARRASMATAAGRWAGRRTLLHAQQHLQRVHAKARRSLLEADKQRGNLLSFSGRSE